MSIPGRTREEREMFPAPSLFDEPVLCQVEGCRGEMLRQTGFCRFHWQQRLTELEKQRKAELKKWKPPTADEEAQN